MKITLINDLSGFGNCSLTAAIPVLSALKHETHPFPTAILSNQTAYESYYMVDCTGHFENFVNEWRKIGEKTDCVYLGFTPSKIMPQKAAALAEEYGAKFLFDPVLGDDGELYKCFDTSFIQAYREVLPKADFLTPNLTECCLLCGEDFNSILCTENAETLTDKISDLAEKLQKNGAKNVIVTGVKFQNRLFNVCVLESGRFVIECRYRAKAYSGTGDLFASVFLGYALKGEKYENAVKKAGDFVSECIAYSMKQNIRGGHGGDFFPFLKNL